MASFTAASPVALIPKPRGGVPKDHEWDGVRGAYVHKETRAVHVKGTRSAASVAQQKERKDNRQREDNRDRSSRQQPSGAQNRKHGEAEAVRRDKNRRRNVINYHRQAAQRKAKVPLGTRHLTRLEEERRLLGEQFVFEGQRVRVTEGQHAGCLGVVLERAVLWDGSTVAAIVESAHHHSVLLDEDEDEAGPRRLSPYIVEPWPRVGQQVDT